MPKTSTTKILVAIDQSQQAENAIRYVASLPLAGRVVVTLFHVRRDLPAVLKNIGITPGLDKQFEPERMDSWMKQEMESINKFMDASGQILLDAGYPEKDVEIKVRELKVGFARDILAEAGKGYTAVVLGRSGLSKLKDVVMGSIASKLVSQLGQMPVWVIGGKPQGGKIMVALDNSEGSMRAVDHVAHIIGPGPQEVLLFHVIRSFEYGGQFAQGYIGEDLERRLNEEGRKAIEPVFKRAVKRLTDAGLPAASIESLLITGVPSRAGAIFDHAEEKKYDTIVVGRRGISKVEAFFIGRVGNKVLGFSKKHAVWVVN